MVFGRELNCSDSEYDYFTFLSILKIRSKLDVCLKFKPNLLTGF